LSIASHELRTPLTALSLQLDGLARSLARSPESPEQARTARKVAMAVRVLGRWDRSRVDQALTNLLSNALKYGAGSPVDIALADLGDRATIAVRDRGIGIAPEDRERVFGRFERAVSSSHYGGLGLGLYITQEIARAHGGSIVIESEPGAGATFILTLPRQEPSREIA
jgi:signal transduction histidine kinase